MLPSAHARVSGARSTRSSARRPFCRSARLQAEGRACAPRSPGERDRPNRPPDRRALGRADLAGEPSLSADCARLEELRQSVVEQRIDAQLELGEHEQVIPTLEGLVAAHPLRERLRGQLILALYRAGRQAEALETYRETRRVLVEELAIEPSPELRELERAILRQDPALAPGPLSEGADEPPPPGRSRWRWPRSPLVIGAATMLSSPASRRRSLRRREADCCTKVRLLPLHRLLHRRRKRWLPLIRRAWQPRNLTKAIALARSLLVRTRRRPRLSRVQPRRHPGARRTTRARKRSPPSRLPRAQHHRRRGHLHRLLALLRHGRHRSSRRTTSTAA